MNLRWKEQIKWKAPKVNFGFWHCFINFARFFFGGETIMSLPSGVDMTNLMSQHPVLGALPPAFFLRAASERYQRTPKCARCRNHGVVSSAFSSRCFFCFFQNWTSSLCGVCAENCNNKFCTKTVRVWVLFMPTILFRRQVRIWSLHRWTKEICAMIPCRRAQRRAQNFANGIPIFPKKKKDIKCSC